MSQSNGIPSPLHQRASNDEAAPAEAPLAGCDRGEGDRSQGLGGGGGGKMGRRRFPVGVSRAFPEQQSSVKNDGMTKLCFGCGVEKPRTLEFFYRDKTLKWSSRCKPCASEASGRRYRESEDVRVVMKRQATAWAKANRERQRELARAWREANLQQVRAAERERRARYAASPEWRLRSGFRNRLAKLRQRSGLCPSITVDESIGCSWSTLVGWIEGQFKPGMTWENYGSWHIDHKEPLSQADLSFRPVALRLLGHRNLQPLWGHENAKKGSRAA